MGDYALCFFTDHADPAGRWYTTHGEIRGDASAYPYTPEDYRRVLVLRELHQLSYAEICEVTKLELGTVKSRINRARLLLRNYLAADGNFFEKPASKVTECNQTVGGERNAI